MTAALLAFAAVLVWFIFKVLNLSAQPQRPRIFCRDARFHVALLKTVPSIDKEYVPTRLWGYEGHIQTIVHSVIGRVKCPWPIGERCELQLEDGSTLTYDLYQPLANLKRDITTVIVPGICNSSESVYVRTFVHYAQCHGLRCAVLNHIGTLPTVPVTAPRIFTYGHTGDLNTMMHHITTKYPGSSLICIGYSMGGNLVTKYLGEKDFDKPTKLIGAVSICQGYDILQGTQWLLQWQNFRRLYLYAITEAMKSIILQHRSVLLSDQAKQQFDLVEREIISAATLPELDDAYTRKVHNFERLPDFYYWSSSLNYLRNIRVPMLFINALDDPLIPEILLEPIRDFACSHDNTAYVELTHGGHLGFYEGGILYPNTITWLDRTLVNAVVTFETHSKRHLSLQI